MNKRILNLEEAKRVAAAAESEAARNQWPVVIAIVDDGGHLLYLQREWNVQIGSVEVAIAKARTASLFRRPTKSWEERLAEGRPGYVTMPGVIALEGGVPIVADGQVIGGIGVSGVKSSEDAQIARAGAAVLEHG
jgi:glc operon protein GlcG